MDFLNKVWPYVETVGLPILVAVGGISFYSINYYLRDCKNLYLMESYIKLNKSLRGFNYQIMPFIGFNAVFYAFKSLNNFDEMHMSIPNFKEQVENVRAYRKTYSIVFPIIIALAILGVTINETLIDAN